MAIAVQLNQLFLFQYVCRRRDTCVFEVGNNWRGVTPLYCEVGGIEGRT